MQHTESSMPVYFTSEYARFKMLDGNRQLNEGKINRIIKSITNGNDMLRYYPIQVKENKTRLEILDGQHRYFICRRLKKPVYYIIVQEEKSMADIARVNTNVEKWSNKNFIYCYAQQGNINYQQLQDFYNQYEINVGTSINLLSYGQPGTEGTNRTTKEQFEDGLFECKFLQTATELADSCKLFAPFPYWRDRGFVIAIYKIKKAGLVEIPDLVASAKKYPELLDKQNSYKDYIYCLEQLFNARKQKRTVII